MAEATSTSFDPPGSGEATPSPRKTELLERAYQYALQHGVANISLRPLASAIGSSPRVLLYLFGSKDGLVRALLARARAEELRLLEQLRAERGAEHTGLAVVVERIWDWLAAEDRRGLLSLWVEGYARSLIDPEGPWAGFAEDTVDDWLKLLAEHQPAGERDTAEAKARRTEALAVLRGALLDLLATGDRARVTAAVHAWTSR
ncbi:TetR family transcriptional regulator [Thermocrispum sp.]|jgi:AcrR family transcriptional regulator|uniref:TetR family transcriptional regulator n=1 Tax=Thermocrispum agreste TaxID=37925 RepID=A0ABD6FHK0_9PSEU|nr:TetR family transcriptional regulator [Thermocrispum sp.]